MCDCVSLTLHDSPLWWREKGIVYYYITIQRRSTVCLLHFPSHLMRWHRMLCIQEHNCLQTLPCLESVVTDLFLISWRANCDRTLLFAIIPCQIVHCNQQGCWQGLHSAVIADWWFHIVILFLYIISTLDWFLRCPWIIL